MPWKYIWKKDAIEPTNLINILKAMREGKNTAEKLDYFFCIIFHSIILGRLLRKTLFSDIY